MTPSASPYAVFKAEDWVSWVAQPIGIDQCLRLTPKKTYTNSICDKEKELQFLEDWILKNACSARVCLTYQHLHSSSDIHCITLFLCHINRRLVPHGDHLISSCHLIILQPKRDWSVSRVNLTSLIDRLFWSVCELYEHYWRAMSLYFF